MKRQFRRETYKIDRNHSVYRRSFLQKYPLLSFAAGALALSVLFGIGWGISKALSKPAPEIAPTQVEQKESQRVILPEYDDREDSFYSVSQEELLDFAKLEKAIYAAHKQGVKYLLVPLKDKEGNLLFESEVPLAKEAGVVGKKTVSIPYIKEKLKGTKVKLAVELAAFSDNQMAKASKALAVHYENSGDPWITSDGRRWLDPTNEGAAAYLLALMEDVYRQGADCVVFSHVQFPKENGETQVDWYAVKGAGEDIVTHLNAFLEKAEGRAAQVGRPVFVKVGASDLFQKGEIYGEGAHLIQADNMLVALDMTPKKGVLALDTKEKVGDKSEEEVETLIKERAKARAKEVGNLVFVKE